MTHPQIIENTPISMPHLKEELAKIKKRDGELSFRAQKTEEYLEQLEILSTKEAEEVFNKIQKLDIPRFKGEHIQKIVDMLPRNVTELKMLMQGYALTITNDNLAKVQKIVDDHLPKIK